MIGLNAQTGKLDPGFGKEGEMTMDVPFAGVPTIFKNMIFVGMNLFGPGEEHLHYQDEVPGGPREIPAPTMRAPARSSGSSTPSRMMANPTPTTGRQAVGKAAPETTCGLTR